LKIKEKFVKSTNKISSATMLRSWLTPSIDPRDKLDPYDTSMGNTLLTQSFTDVHNDSTKIRYFHKFYREADKGLFYRISPCEMQIKVGKKFRTNSDTMLPIGKNAQEHEQAQEQEQEQELEIRITVAYQLNSDSSELRYGVSKHVRRSRQHLEQLIKELDPLNHRYLEQKAEYEHEMHRTKTWCRKRALNEATQQLLNNPQIIKLDEESCRSKLDLQDLIVLSLQACWSPTTHEIQTEDHSNLNTNTQDILASDHTLQSPNILKNINKFILYVLAFYASFFYVDLLFS
jgi:hypothetical protein